MENEQNEELLNNEDENAFGPHIKEVNEYGRSYKKYFFTTLYKEQDVKKNKIFIKWKKEMKKINDLIIHCPKCYAYFPNAAYTNCRCDKCSFFFCFGCNRAGCNSKDCIKWWKIIIPFFGLKEYGDRNIFLKILMYFAMLFQVLFTFPLQILYKMGPIFLGEDGFESYEKYLIPNLNHRCSGSAYIGNNDFGDKIFVSNSYSFYTNDNNIYNIK